MKHCGKLSTRKEKEILPGLGRPPTEFEAVVRWSYWCVSELDDAARKMLHADKDVVNSLELVGTGTRRNRSATARSRTPATCGATAWRCGRCTRWASSPSTACRASSRPIWWRAADAWPVRRAARPTSTRSCCAAGRSTPRWGPPSTRFAFLFTRLGKTRYN